jgi:hypothetical protein
MGDYEKALRGLLMHEARFWEYWGEDPGAGC